MTQRTTQQNKLYHELCGKLHKELEVIVWDGRLKERNPIQLTPPLDDYSEFRVSLARSDLDYPRDNEGKPVSSTKLSIEEMNSHINFLEVLCAEFGE